MRAICLVNKLELEFSGNMLKDAITLGDIDNDGHNELIIGNEKGEIAIFKGSERLQTLSGLNFIICLAVGDIRNQGKNSLVVLNGEGWCYIYEALHDSLSSSFKDFTVCDAEAKEVTDEIDGQGPSSSNHATTETHSSADGEPASCEPKSTVKNNLKNPLVCVHKQMLKPNVAAMLLDDVDSDGHIELVVGLTDRVIRSYRFSSKDTADLSEGSPTLGDGPQCGELVNINRWECANQIGSITLHHSSDGKPAIIVSQPGGTFMRIICHSDGVTRTNEAGIEVAYEAVPESIDYQFLGISRMRNSNIATQIVSDINSPPTEEGAGSSTAGTGRPYAVATLDGTIMLVRDEVILWAIAVDHQVFAINKLDITGDGYDEIVACCWDGQTYILDQKKNSVRFHLEEPVRVFHSGWYTVDTTKGPVTALVYVTFKSTVVVYYNIPLKDLICKKFEPELEHLSELYISDSCSKEQALEIVKNLNKKEAKDVVEYVLYDFIKSRKSGMDEDKKGSENNDKGESSAIGENSDSESSSSTSYTTESSTSYDEDEIDIL